MTTPFRAALLAAVLAIAAGACGDTDDDATTATPSDDGTEETRPGTTEVKAPTGSKPEVVVPDGPPPTKLEIKDLIEGTGPVAATGQRVTVQYVGVSYSTKKQFDASWDNGQPFTFQLGAGGVIDGWDQGVPGMKVGGRRQLIIPPDLGYGDRGAGADIKPGETLVFVVDLLSVS
ncbi:MAG TPA: FKBP-type peptidyl-prolyl cis-trans isomerase [Acidimicrobiales bacterium]|nr:FKBP-type peptidyl-prolyl cis-trans isomerase [Acidimicrobiales bacterium]